MKNWKIDFLPEAQADLKRLDGSVKKDVLRIIQRVSEKPGYPDGYGKPLAANLAGLYKIKFKRFGIRAVYALLESEEQMTIIIISARADGEVYTEAAKRREKHGL